VSPIPVARLFKGSNITLIADGLQPSRLHPTFFPELGTAKNSVQITTFGALDFGQYSFVVLVDNRRAIANDATNELSGLSPLAGMMKKFIRGLELTVEGVGFNYSFEVTFDGPAVDFVQTFLHAERLTELGNRLQSAGFKTVHDCGDHLLQTALEPVWKQPNALTVLVNFHYERPVEAAWDLTLDKYSRNTAEVSAILDRIFDVSAVRERS
jgi:hypothetical protein